MARWDPRRRAEKQKLTELDKTLGAGQHGQQQAAQGDEDGRLRQPGRRNRVLGLFKRLRPK
jgi:hypothetical protein